MASDGEDTQVLDDGGTPPPLGSPCSDGERSESDDDDDGVLYGETQVLDEDETQAVDDVLEEEEEEEVVAGDWEETQLVEDSEEDCGKEEEATQKVEGYEEGGGGEMDEQEKTQMVAECEEEEDGGGMEDDAGDWGRTQLVEECDVDNGGNTNAGFMVDTQLVECDTEEERLSSSGDEDVGDWGMTQVVEDSDEEIGNDELSEGTQVVGDNEGLTDDETDVKEHDDTKNLVDSDASTDEEGGTVGTRHLATAREAFTVNSVQQRKWQDSTNGTCVLTAVVDNSTSCSTSFGDHPDYGIDDGSYGYVQSHDKDGSKSKGRCSTAKKLFADTTAKKNETKTTCFAGLSYVGSQEPGDMSQANALEVVEGLISTNGGLSSQEPTPKKLRKAKPPVSIKMGTLLLAEKVDRCRSSNEKAEIFSWVDSREDDGGGDFFSKNKDMLLQKSAGKGKSKISKGEKCSTKNAPAENKIGGPKNRTNPKSGGRIETLPLSDSRQLKSDVKTKRASGNRTKKNLLKDLDDLSNANPLEGQQAKVVSYDIGQDTQMALEAIETLAQSSPAKILSANGEPPVDRDTRVGSKITRGHAKDGPARKRTSSHEEGVTTRSKRIKVTELNLKPPKERQRGTKVQENSEDHRTKTKHKQAEPLPQKNKALKVPTDGNKYDGTLIARRTRHASKNNLYECSVLCSNKQLKNGMNLKGDNSKTGEVQNSHVANEPEQPMISEKRTTESGSNYVQKESTEYTCANNAQNLQGHRNGSMQHASANVPQNLEQFRDEPTTHFASRERSSHPKRRRTPTAMVQAKAPALTTPATDHDIQPEVSVPSKKRRIFIRSSELLKYARRGPSNGRSNSMLSSIIAKSSPASPILESSKNVDSRTSGVSSSGQRQKACDAVGGRKSPNNNSPVQNSAVKTPSKVINKLSPTFSPLNPSKASSRSLSKPSVARELLELDPENALSSQRRKDCRRRKDMTGSNILFSHHLHEDVIKRQKKILARLGVSEAFSITDATHFVADDFFRTKNMLEAITRGKLVVTSMWLERCGQAGCFVDEKKYILRDARKEKEFGFSMPISLASAHKHPLLLGKKVFVTPNVKPSREVVTSLVSASSGQCHFKINTIRQPILVEERNPQSLFAGYYDNDWVILSYKKTMPLERIGRSIMKKKEAPDDLLIISCEEDYEICIPLVERGANVFNSELLLSGIIIQKLEYERHRLFSDRVKQTRSTRWLKHATQDRFVPVSKS